MQQTQRNKIPIFILVVVTLLLSACKPTADGQSVTTYVNQPIEIRLTGSDQDGDPLTFRIVDAPQHGAVSGTPPSVTYTPAVDYIGADVFTFVANDGKDDSAAAKVKITVAAGSAQDRDGDGVANDGDAFPDDAAEIYDSNGDGVGNFAEADEDGDGTRDELDAFPYDATRSALPVTTEMEFNDNPADATVVSDAVPFSVQGVIQANIDGDFFRFQGQANRAVTALLNKTAAAFKPSVTVLDATGNVLPAAELNLGGFSQAWVGISVVLPADGTYFIAVTDFNSNGDVSFEYGVDVFSDEDLDGLDDSVAEALGINILKADSDDDGLLDLVESLLVLDQGLDVDRDGLPNWLDRDADGDTLLDAIEGSADVDGDTAPNFVDLDADGNGIVDTTERGEGINPLDTDNDSRFDFVDLDDDGDGLPDTLDDDRLVALQVSDELDEANRLILDRVEYQVADQRVLNVAPAGASVTLYGLGFSAGGADNKVMFKSGDGVVSVAPSAIAADSLTLTLPDAAQSPLFVVSNGRRSNDLALEIVDPRAPLLFSQGLAAYQAGDSVTLNGQNFSAPMSVNVGGIEVPASIVSIEQASFILPQGASNGSVSVSTASGISNTIALAIESGAAITISLPAGAGVAFSELTAAAGLFDGVVVDSNGNAAVQVSTSQREVVSVFYNDAQGETLYLQGISFPDSVSVSVNVQSTALTAVVLSSAVLSRLEDDQLEGVWAALLQRPEVVQLSTTLATGLSADPHFLLSPSAIYLRELNAAVNAAEQWVESALSTAQIASAQLSGPEITPEQHDVKVFAITRNQAFTGNIAVENDSQLFLSTQIVNRLTGDVLYGHITSYFDGNTVGPQRGGILFDAETKSDYGQCGFIDCDVNLITAGANPVASNRSVAQILAARTIIERVAYPIFEYALGLEISPSAVTKILVNVAPTLVNTVGNQAANGSPEDAAKSLVNYLYDDIRTPPSGGPVTQAFIARYGSGLTAALKEKLAKRLASKAIPVLGQLSTALEVIGAAGTGWGVSKAVYDIASTPGNLDYEVVWPMEVVDIIPKAVSIDEGPVTLILKGQGLGKVETIRLVDQGPGGQPPKVLNPSVVTADQRAVSTLIPSAYLAEAVGPIEISITGPDNAYDTSPVLLEVVADLTIVQLIADQGAPGDVIEVHGAGFHPVRIYNQVTFQGNGQRLTATVLDATRHVMRVRVPAGAVSGNVTVVVDNKTSNGVWFEVEEGNVIINFGDNGSANDDTFGLYVDSSLIHAMPAPTRSAGPFSLRLTPGTHYVTLRGITAPDDVGTYFISFSGDVLSVSGDAVSGSDLTAGVEKYWTLEVSSGASPTAQPTLQAAGVVPWQEE